MDLEELGRSVHAETERRTLLRQAGAVGVAAIAGVLAKTRPAQAEEIVTFRHHECNLCFPPANYGGPSCPSLRCAWCWWSLCHGRTGNRHQNLCCEGYGYNSGGRCCSPGCPGVVCSFLGEYSRKCQGREIESRCMADRPTR